MGGGRWGLCLVGVDRAHLLTQLRNPTHRLLKPARRAAAAEAVAGAVIPQCRAQGASLEGDDDGGGRCTRSNHTAGKRCQSFNGEITVVVNRSQGAVGHTNPIPNSSGRSSATRESGARWFSRRFWLLWRAAAVLRIPGRRCVWAVRAWRPASASPTNEIYSEFPAHTSLLAHAFCEKWVSKWMNKWMNAVLELRKSTFGHFSPQQRDSRRWCWWWLLRLLWKLQRLNAANVYIKFGLLSLGYTGSILKFWSCSPFLNSVYGNLVWTVSAS